MNKKFDTSVRNYTIEDLEYILDKLPYQVWLKDKKGKYIYINKLGAEKVGLSKQEIIGKTDYEIRDYDIAKKCDETDKTLIDNNNDIYNEEHINMDGQDIWYKVHKFIVNRDTDKEDIIGGIGDEISLDKNIQLELENNLLKYLDRSKTEDECKKILNSILMSLKKFLNCKSIDILLYDENKKGFTFYLSDNEDESKFKNNLYIYIDEEIENKLCSNKIDENRYSEIYDKITQLQNSKIEDNLRLKHIKLSNKLFGLVCISYNRDINPTYEAELSLDEILTKISIIIKQIENKGELLSINKRKDELESIIELECIKTDFLANISHEFRTPINIILSVVQLLNSFIEGKIIDLNTEKCKEYLNILKQNSYRLLRLVNNIIDTAKISNNFYELKLRNHNIISIVENIAMSAASFANEKRRNIVFDTDEEEVILACDIDKIEWIILNLISNAIKFSNSNTDIEIKIKTNFEQNRVFISVKNYGETIDELDRDRIFEKFVQIDNLYIRKNEGSGIGLFLAKKLVEMHNGDIYLDEIENATQFTFYLPINTIDEEDVYIKTLNENDIVEKCNIEFSDIYI